MTRDEAIKIAASALSSDDTTPWDRWAESVVMGADALLAAMGDPDTIAEHRECCAAQARITEARVVAEIVAWLRERSWQSLSRDIERGDWRAKDAK